MKRKRQLYQRQRPFERRLRVAEFLRTSLTDLIQNKTRDPRIAQYSLTITGVEVSKDLGFADVYVSCPEATDDKKSQEILDLLTKASGFFRSELAQLHDMRTTPALRFKLDRSNEHAARIDELLAKVRYS